MPDRTINVTCGNICPRCGGCMGHPLYATPANKSHCDPACSCKTKGRREQPEVRSFILRRAGIPDIDVTSSVDRERAQLRDAEREVERLTRALAESEEARQCAVDTAGRRAKEVERLAVGLRRIRGLDYRGNRSEGSTIAYRVLDEGANYGDA